jgi:hypothetical protein
MHRVVHRDGGLDECALIIRPQIERGFREAAEILSESLKSLS